MVFFTRDIITIYRRQYEKRRHFRNALHSIKTWPLLRSFMVNLGIWNNGILEIKLWLSMTFDPCCPGLRIQLTAPAWSFYPRPLQGKVARINVSWKDRNAFWVEFWVGSFLEIFALSEKLLWSRWGRKFTRQGMLIRRMKRKQIEKVEERKMGWWEETGEEKERGAGHHSNIDLLSPLFRYLRLSETVGKQELPESAFS